MKNAPALYLELMDGVLENKEEEEENGRRLRGRLWGCIILDTCLFFVEKPSSSEPVAALQPTLTVKTQRLAKGLKKTKVKPSICPRRG